MLPIEANHAAASSAQSKSSCVPAMASAPNSESMKGRRWGWKRRKGRKGKDKSFSGGGASGVERCLAAAAVEAHTAQGTPQRRLAGGNNSTQLHPMLAMWNAAGCAHKLFVLAVQLLGEGVGALLQLPNLPVPPVVPAK